MKKLIISILTIAAFNTAILAQTAEQFGGFGISVYPGKKGASVSSVLPNSPAAEAGLQAGDVIISVNGTLLSTVAPEKQLSLLRGTPNSSVSLQISRAGETINIHAKRASISVQNLNSEEVSKWYGKNAELTPEDISYLASLQTGEGYELLGVMQNGVLIDSAVKSSNLKQMHQISLKKQSSIDDNAAKSITASGNKLHFINRSAISFSIEETGTVELSILNAKGATVWQKSFSNLPIGTNSVSWNASNLPAGSYNFMLKSGKEALAQKFSLK